MPSEKKSHRPAPPDKQPSNSKVPRWPYPTQNTSPSTSPTHSNPNRSPGKPSPVRQKDLLAEIANRVGRIETRLVRLMRVNGLDEAGNLIDG